MTFGRTLQELTRLCGVKRCNLADALGYDPSYISRWINGVKHPSLRSNDALPAQIAAYLTANAAPDVRARIAGQFDLRCDAADDAGFSAALASLLADTIAADRAAGYRLLLATASFHLYVDAIARRLGIDDVLATRLDEPDGADHIHARLAGEKRLIPRMSGTRPRAAFRAGHRRHLGVIHRSIPRFAP